MMICLNRFLKITIYKNLAIAQSLNCDFIDWSCAEVTITSSSRHHRKNGNSKPNNNDINWLCQASLQVPYYWSYQEELVYK